MNQSNSLLFYKSLYLSTVVGNISVNISSLVKYERRYVTKDCTHATDGQQRALNFFMRQIGEKGRPVQKMSPRNFYYLQSAFLWTQCELTATIRSS